ncbi:type II secretion system protein [Paenibacillus sp. FSL R7-0345]|uniref:type II secretion system protein n=1 Tax=Paenibacillus sp. FSL R7-0345 TaxID=2954535 RepID=UPI00315A90C8
MLTQAIRKKLSKAGKEEKGFTLIELLAVVVILGIIAVIAIPLITGLINKTGDKSDLATARQVYEASRLYITTELNGKAGDLTIPVIGLKATSTAAATGLWGNGYIEDDMVLPSNKEKIVGGNVHYVGDKLADTAAAGSVAAVPAVTLITANKTVSFTVAQIMKSELSATP